ncbi:MAG: chemotaxis protein CheV, partial [candidate division Zixibacteria bacterium]|nr:chemotaxis protein CheV [candidate division Zixibacteria bacterium]
MELLIFRLGDTHFGINVAKVREIIQRIKTVDIAFSHETVEGFFKLRSEVLTLVNIGRYFDMIGEETKSGNGLIVIVEFNEMRCGILVDSVEEIHRLRWDKIEPPSQFLSDIDAPITGTTEIDGKTVLITDFESVIEQILGIHSAAMPENLEEVSIARDDVKIILADDSPVLRKALKKILNKSGFKNLTICSDGKKAWEKIQEWYNKDGSLPDLLLSDIEMPQMDGLHLTSRIKKDPTLQNIPVVLFSSLITEDNKRKGISVGADAQVSKPDSEGMIRVINECLAKKGTVLKES